MTKKKTKQLKSKLSRKLIPYTSNFDFIIKDMETIQFRHKNDQMKKIPCNHYLNEAAVSNDAKKLLKR